MTALNVRFSKKEHEDLVKIGKLSERSLNELIREAVRLYVKNYTQD